LQGEAQWFTMRRLHIGLLVAISAGIWFLTNGTAPFAASEKLPLKSKAQESALPEVSKTVLLAAFVSGRTIIWSLVMSLTSFFPAYMSWWGLHTVLIGVAISLASIPNIFVLPLASGCIQRYGRTCALDVALATSVLGMGILGFAPLIPQGHTALQMCLLVAARLLQGTATATWDLVSFGMVDEIWGEESSEVIGIISFCSNMGEAAAPLLGGILYHLGGFRFACVTLAVTSMFCMIPIRSIYSQIATLDVQTMPKPLEDCHSGWSGWVTVAWQVPGMLVSSLCAGFAYGYIAATTELEVSSVDDREADSLNVFYGAAVLGTFCFFYSMGGFMAGRLANAQRWGPRVVIFRGSVLAAFSYFTLACAGSMPTIDAMTWLPLPQHVVMLCLAVSLLGFASVAQSVPVVSAMRELMGGRANVNYMVGLWLLSYHVGVTLGSVLGPSGLVHFGFSRSVGIIGAITLCLVCPYLHAVAAQDPEASSTSGSALEVPCS